VTDGGAGRSQPQDEELEFQMQLNKRSSRRGVAVLSAALVLSGVTVLTPAASRAADSPRTVVELNSQKVLAILNSGDTDDEKIKRLEQLAYGVIDFDTVSRLVLAKYWKQFNPEQRQQFEEEFKRALTVSYGRRIGQFGQEKVVILGERQEPLGDVTVQSRIVGGKAGDIKVDYRLRQKDGTWYVIDVIVEGVSIVSSYRTQFQEIIGQGGPERLLADLRQKNASGEGLAPVETTAKDGTSAAQ
jgi:phospholipid transport system substrate-binding protein